MKGTGATVDAPTVAELRAATQPPGLLDRNSGEHWAGRLYMRRVSPYLTRLLLRTPLTPNGVTWLMILAGLLAALALSFPGLWTAFAAFAFIQLQLLLDCSDGELARWRQMGSPVGIYLDRVGHYVTEAALPIALGIRADGGWDSLGGWTTLGLICSVFVLLKMSQAALVHVARAEAGRPLLKDTAAVAAPRASGLRRVRRALGFVPFFRAFVAVEATLLALAAAVFDAVLGELAGTRGLLLALVPLSVVIAAGRLFAILASDRLR
ncbi:MAG: CDP-alcohol phosphatidyltransferase family protein [Actinomycetota bacterium]|nr:CDP-alcohol phosphatidyltransferase family protein [Actinomycetota bacterium]